ncbi:hypothetical protein TK49_03935 [Ralstonia mannitolilytica]|nr:hypothetical protein TK49_03935 [Ralstonia mannitolilytica]
MEPINEACRDRPQDQTRYMASKTKTLSDVDHPQNEDANTRSCHRGNHTQIAPDDGTVQAAKDGILMFQNEMPPK